MKLKRIIILVFVSFIIISCNVASLITDAETNLGSNFGYDVRDGLLHFWRFDTTGDQYDDYGGITLINNFGVLSINGKFGAAIQCDSAGSNANGALKSTSASIVIPSGNDFAIAFWIKPDITYTSLTGVIFSDNNSVDIHFGDFNSTSSNDLYVDIMGMTSTFYDLPAPVGSWTHIAINFYNGGDLRDLYVNGIHHESMGGLSAMNVNSTQLSFCSLINGGSELEGAIDSFGFWERTLEDEAIQALYSGIANVD